MSEAAELPKAGAGKIRCDACPVMCIIKDGQAGACDRYANHGGQLARVDPHILLNRTLSQGGSVVPFAGGKGRRHGDRRHRRHFQLLRRQGED
jgi:hypothetical protein